ncbi:MAG: hypothetical protein A3C11_02425 [Candidatus Sungbacteria bacterium RIFCSPHIGHO2_02_FULL_49_12]|uniref:TfoX N-terminal domain-containing protein n=1 Tax=Candidatus Sungbacteria bacterium RIFCSPHIGHO2_02_FULL_49_12 TaxID=1802271 RepID=A0A1G2KQ72_9BACT|nr:MAG: hypothetical protein A3C11_02425 [Candidatus Sungbacteria bacterium RIFCSPHIGHO2_02_FULL_49_12]
MTQKSLAAYLESQTAKWPRRYIRHLFGSVGFFYGPKLFAFLMENSFGIKVPEAGRKQLLRDSGAKQFFNAGKPFGRWLEVPFPETKKEAENLLPYFRRAYLLAKHLFHQAR